MSGNLTPFAYPYLYESAFGGNHCAMFTVGAETTVRYRKFRECLLSMTS